jgi:hypothetical protein
MMANSSRFADPELAFVVSAVAPTPAYIDAHTISDWSRVMSLARRHRVYPRVWQRASHHFPEEQATAMRGLVAENGLAALRNLARTVEVTALLRRAGLESIVLKGPLLAHELYGDVALRVSGDIDLLVREEDLLRAAQIIAGAGYRHHTALNATALARHRKSQHDVAFSHPDDDSLIELHADIAQPLYGYRIDLDIWWRDSRPRSIGSDTVSVLSPEHAYLLSSLHAAKHRWHRLDLVADIAAFGRLGIDRAAVGEEIAGTWLLSPIETGEALAAWLFSGNEPNSRSARQARSKLVAGDDFRRWSGIAFDLGLRPKPVEKARYLWRRLLSAKLGM